MILRIFAVLLAVCPISVSVAGDSLIMDLRYKPCLLIKAERGRVALTYLKYALSDLHYEKLENNQFSADNAAAILLDNGLLRSGLKVVFKADESPSCQTIDTIYTQNNDYISEGYRFLTPEGGEFFRIDQVYKRKRATTFKVIKESEFGRENIFSGFLLEEKDN